MYEQGGIIRVGHDDMMRERVRKSRAQLRLNAGEMCGMGEDERERVPGLCQELVQNQWLAFTGCAHRYGSGG